MAEKKEEKKMTYEQAMKQLEDIVTKLENNKDLSLDDSIKYFEKGTKLAEFCNQELDRAEEKIKQINARQDVPAAEEPASDSSNDQDLPF